MGADEIVDQKPRRRQAPTHPPELVDEGIVGGNTGLAHGIQYPVANMLGGHLHAAADVKAAQFFKAGIGRRIAEEVVAEPAADKSVLDAGQLANPAIQGQTATIAGIQPVTGGRDQTTPVGAIALGGPARAGGPVQIGRGAAHVGNRTAKVRVLGQTAGFPQDGRLAAALHHAPLVEIETAEIAFAAAPAMGHQGVADRFQPGYTAHGVVLRMPAAPVVQIVDRIQLRFGQGPRGRKDDRMAVPMGLNHGSAGERVLFSVKTPEGRIEILGGGADRLEGRQDDNRVRVAGVLADHRRSGDTVQGIHRLPRRKPPGDFDHRALPHAVNQNVGPGIEKNRAPHAVVPVVVMGQPAHAGLEAADHHGSVLERLAHAVGVDDQGPVGTQARAPPRRKVVGLAGPLVGRIVGHHGIDIARGDTEEQTRRAQPLEIIDAAPIRLGNDAHPEAACHQHPADQRHPKGRMIHVGIPGDQDDVQRIPTPWLHIRS
ncbi:conserved hypothetical protein [Desulfosarcina cetonica]|nr:conserved hypothetical protein [Desulfosarcina cetonica]